MEPGFQLNLHDRDKNPCFESHDPSMMYDPVSGMYYSYSTDAALTSSYRQGIPVRRSRDLVHFSFVGYALSEQAILQGRNNGPGYKPTFGFWAPYVEYAGGEYRMYYSATKAFGSSESRIWLAVAERPEGPFENRGVVMDTWHTPDTEPNAIDAHVADTPEGRKYFIYGSFFGGIYIKELDPATGMPVNSDPRYQGDRIARRPERSFIDGPEGAAVIYHPGTEFYYLFLSYGWLGDDYDIRVGRSRCITGPYLDYEGRSLDGEGWGMKLAGSYRFQAHNPWVAAGPDWEFAGFRGPGHGVPFYDPVSGQYFFVHHVRDGAEIFRHRQGDRDSFRMHYMAVRRMFFLDGWPLLSPQPYAGEGGEPHRLGNDVLYRNDIGANGTDGETQWEWLRFKYRDNSQALSVCAPLPKDLPPERTLVFDCFDFENSRESLGLAGITDTGETIWGKQI
ncbi:MAG: arabinan endo-1,5-alpha-L-arabinosidase [Lachnospiraceae bacterium]|nr:arabinan endo-1,5-alpha-L-arabinosidase [Lachnospiraceae bacterium]